MSNKLEESLTDLQNAISNLRKQLEPFGFVIPLTKTRAPLKKISIEVIVQKNGAIIYQVPGSPGANGVSVYVNRGDKIEWQCQYPFTIYYGATSPITPAKDGKPTVPDIKAKKNEGDPFKTKEMYIHRNTLNGAYKYTVSVLHPETKEICVDDPETIVPVPPGRGPN